MSSSSSSSTSKFNALSCSYIPCTDCNAFFAVRVPCSSMSQEAFTIQCSKCNHVCSVIPNLHPAKLGHDDLQVASKSTKALGNQAATESIASENRVVNKPPSKRQRAPSLYNQFIKEEIQRIKLKNPDTPHREAFSAAAKNWARFPDLHFGLMLKSTAADQPNKIQKGGGEHLKQLLK